MIQKRETPYLSELIKKFKRNIHDLTREETALISQKNLVLESDSGFLFNLVNFNPGFTAYNTHMLL